MQAEERMVASGDVTLAGTLTLPDIGTDTAVLMIHGSGPLDRDENMPGQALNVFNAFAADLAERGVAAFRYDKRGCGASGGDFATAGIAELTDDAEAALTALRDGSLGRFGRIFLLGHSEGTIIAADIAGRDDELAGLVLLSPFFQPIESILRAQAVELKRALEAAPGVGGRITRFFARLGSDPIAEQDKLIARLKETDEASFTVKGQQVPAKQLRELMALDPPAIYARVTVPTLVLGGSKDLQCDPDDVARIAETIGPAARPVVVPDLTHILRTDDGDHTLLSYARLLDRAVDRAVLMTVGGFVTPPPAD